MRMQVMHELLFDSQAHLIQEHKHCTKCEIFLIRLAGRESILTQENESRA